MRFCQADGTPLIDDQTAFDPYATIVAPAKPADTFPVPIAPPIAPSVADAEPVKRESGPEIHATVGSIPIAEPEDVLDLPVNDPLKTMHVSDAEMRTALQKQEPAGDIIEIPLIEKAPEPEPPGFLAADKPVPPPSPFSSAESISDDAEPAPSFYDEPLPPPPAYDERAPAFDEAATMIQPSFDSPFDQSPAAPVAEWSPPTSPDANWQYQDVGANTPFQPQAEGTQGESKGLAIGALVTGILSCLCCFSVITGPVAIVLGFLARKKIDEDPAQFGGRGLAIGGMVTGAIGFLIGIAVIILQLFFGLLGNIG